MCGSVAIFALLWFGTTPALCPRYAYNGREVEDRGRCLQVDTPRMWVGHYQISHLDFEARKHAQYPHH